MRDRSPRHIDGSRGKRVLVALIVALVLSGCGGGDDGESDAAAMLSQAPVATRVASPFAYRATLLTADAEGRTYAQVTNGVYEHATERAAIEVISGGEGPTDFTNAIMVDENSRVLLAIDGDQVSLRVDVIGVSEGEWTRTDTDGGDGPSAAGTVSVLNAITAGNTADARRIGEIGDIEVHGATTTQYRLELPVVDATPFLPREILTYLTGEGMRRSQVSGETTIDVWIDAEGLIRAVEVDFQPLVEHLGRRGWEQAGDISRFEMIFEIVALGGVSADIPAAETDG